MVLSDNDRNGLPFDLTFPIVKQSGGGLESCTVAFNNFSVQTVTVHYVDANGQYKSTIITAQSQAITDVAKGTVVVFNSNYYFQQYAVATGGTLIAVPQSTYGMCAVVPNDTLCIVTGIDGD